MTPSFPRDGVSGKPGVIHTTCAGSACTASFNDYRAAAATKSPTPDWPPRCSSTPSTTGYSRPAWPTSTATNPAPSEQPHPPTEPPSTTSHEQPDPPREPDPTIQNTTQKSRLRRFSPLVLRRAGIGELTVPDSGARALCVSL